MQPGDFFVVRTNGWAAHLIRWVTRSTVNHAGIYVGANEAVEGRPAGAGVIPISAYPHAIWSSLPLTPDHRAGIVRAAIHHEGAPYSWYDCAAIGLADLFGWHVPAFIKNRLADPNRLMCSAYVDQCYREAGVQLFQDGRVPGAVSPGDLLAVIQHHAPIHQGA